MRKRLTTEPSMRNHIGLGSDPGKPDLSGSDVAVCRASRPETPARVPICRTCPNRGRVAISLRRVVIYAVLVLACAFGLSPVRASDDPVREPSIGTSGPELGSTADHVHVTGVRSPDDRRDTLLITLRIDPGFHVNANPATSDNLIPTSVAFVGMVPERIVYPPSIRFKTRFADDVLDVYEGSVVIAATFSSGALDQANGLDFTVTAQACTEEVCLPPDEIPARATW